MTKEGDAVLVGKVLSLRDGLTADEAVAIREEHVFGVGSVSGLVERANEPRVLNFGNRTLLPGFVDGHAHATACAIGSETMVDCVNTCSSIAELQQVLSDNISSRADSRWLVARAPLMFNLRWGEGRYPTRQELDRVSTAIPIALRTGHLTILNSRALEVAGIEQFIGVEQGPSGPLSIQIGADGKPNGAINNMDQLLPLPEADAAVLRRSIESGIRRVFTSQGITSVGEITDTLESIEATIELIDAHRIGTRLTALLRVPRTLRLEQVPAWRTLGIQERSGRFDVRGLKLFADGGYSSSDAAVYAPYDDRFALEPGSKGKLNFSDDELAAIARSAAQAGLQLCLHTNGERSQEQACRVIGALGLRDTLPLRLEHAGNWVWEADTPEVWRRAGALPVPQPPFLYTMAPAMPMYLGSYGAQHGRLPFKSLLADGWELPASSDMSWPFEDGFASPFFSMWCCMRRTGWDGEEIDPEEAIDLESALRMHTIDGARLLGVDARRGTLEPGKVADVVVIDRDLTTVDAENMRDVTVDFVFMDGELVYTREGAEAFTEEEEQQAHD
jgi:predicted amidohydrolase YtcJ